METLTIDRSKWRTGENGPNQTGLGRTKLKNERGFKCCLGFECERIGADIGIGTSTPRGLPWGASNHLVNVGRETSNSEFTREAMDINDNEYLTPEEREAKITAHFLTGGIQVEFINEYIKP